MSFDFSTLITDRAASDLENLRALLSTPMEDWTAEQLAQFNQAISKGAYNYTDLNRVTACMEYLDETLRAYGYKTGYQRIEVPHKTQSRLPEGYTELAYIESTGTQYIDTGFKPAGNTRVLIDIDILSTTPSVAGIFGARDASNTSLNSFVLWKISQTAFRSDYNTVSTNLDVTPTGRYLIDKNKNVTIIGDVTQTFDAASFQSTHSLILFSVNNNGTVDSRYAHARIYSCKLYDNNNLFRDLIPAEDSSGIVGLYDAVNMVFYTNNGTGTFTSGPEVEDELTEELDPYTWYESDTPTAPQMAQYLSNVLSIWSTIMGDPTLPETMVNLTQEGANQIEAALIEINTAIEQIIAAMARSNSFTFWSGNRPFPTAYSNRGRNWAELDAMGTSWRNWQVATWYLLLYGNLEAEGDVT